MMLRERLKVFTGLAVLAGVIGSGTPGIANDSSAGPTTILTGEQALAFQSGYIVAHEEVSGTVAGARQAKSLFAGDDVLYVRFPRETAIQTGDHFTLYKPAQPVFHPITGAFIGRLITILGIVEVTTVPVDEVSKARIVRSFDSISPGNPVMPYKAPPPVPDQGASDGSVSGVIVEFKAPRQLTAQGDIVYIDRGAADGVSLGDRFTVIRLGTRQSPTTRLPDEPVAELKIIGLQEQTATAYVTKSLDTLRRGDVIIQLSSREERAGAPLAAVTEAPRALPTDIYFAFDRWDLSEDGKMDLADIAEFLKEHPAAKLLIEGHCDERGSREYNLVLGEKRAQEVRRYLLNLGVTNPLNITSYGKERPVCTEPDETCYARNRRAHLVITGD